MTSLNPHPELVDGVNVDAVASAVRACPGVDDLAAGPLGSAVVSYLPGRQLAGVSVHDDHVMVQVRAQWGTILPDLARQIRSRVADLVGGRRVDVGVAELVNPPGWDDDAEEKNPGDAGPGRDGRDEVGLWTRNDVDEPGGISSAPTTPTAAVTPPRSSPD